MFDKIACEHPRFLLHPMFDYLYFDCDMLLLDDAVCSKSNYEHIHGSDPCKDFLIPRELSESSLLSRYGFIKDGVVSPMYIAAACGKCDACRSAYVNSLKQRVLLQSSSDKVQPVFFTLTYNEEHNPVSVDKQAVQKFKKRFAKEYRRQVCDEPLKWLIVSEYGTDSTRRPHYHGVLLNYRGSSGSSYKDDVMLHQLFQYSWRDNCKKPHVYMTFDEYVSKYPLVRNIPKGYDPNSFGYVNIEYAKSSKVTSYITKYMSKDNDVPDGRKPNFKLVSIRLGLDYVVSNFNYNNYLKTQQFEFTDFQGHKKSVPLCGYYLKYLFPNFSKLFPTSIRRSWFNFWESSDALLKFRYTSPAFARQIVLMRESMLDKFVMFPEYHIFSCPKNLYTKDIENISSLTTRPHNSFVSDHIRLLLHTYSQLSNFDIPEDYEFRLQQYDRLIAVMSRRESVVWDTGTKRRKEVSFYKSKTLL